MGAVDLKGVLKALNARSDFTDEVKRSMREALRQIARESGDSSLEHEERVEFARRLLDAKEPRSTIRERLMARFEIKKSQAYRDIGEALQLSQKRRFDGTSPSENDINEEAIVQE